MESTIREKNTYLALNDTGTLVAISAAEWHAIVQENKALPPELQRYFMINRIPEMGYMDCMYIEVDRPTYREWHREDQAADRNREYIKDCLYLSLDATVKDAEAISMHETVSSKYCLEDHVSWNLIRNQVAMWKPWDIELLEAMLDGTYRKCTRKLAQKYAVSERQFRNYKQQFKQKLIFLLDRFPF